MCHALTHTCHILPVSNKRQAHAMRNVMPWSGARLLGISCSNRSVSRPITCVYSQARRLTVLPERYRESLLTATASQQRAPAIGCPSYQPKGGCFSNFFQRIAV